MGVDAQELGQDRLAEHMPHLRGGSDFTRRIFGWSRSDPQQTRHQWFGVGVDSNHPPRH